MAALGSVGVFLGPFYNHAGSYVPAVSQGTAAVYPNVGKTMFTPSVPALPQVAQRQQPISSDGLFSAE